MNRFCCLPLQFDLVLVLLHFVGLWKEPVNTMQRLTLSVTMPSWMLLNTCTKCFLQGRWPDERRASGCQTANSWGSFQIFSVVTGSWRLREHGLDMEFGELQRSSGLSAGTGWHMWAHWSYCHPWVNMTAYLDLNMIYMVHMCTLCPVFLVQLPKRLRKQPWANWAPKAPGGMPFG